MLCILKPKFHEHISMREPHGALLLFRDEYFEKVVVVEKHPDLLVSRPHTRVAC
jgi:hypothetical protein